MMQLFRTTQENEVNIHFTAADPTILHKLGGNRAGGQWKTQVSSPSKGWKSKGAIYGINHHDDTEVVQLPSLT